MVGIYRIYNAINEKNYVGQSGNIKRRWREHIRRLENDRHENQHLQRSWRKYGVECFEFSVLEECEPELLIEREQFWMDYYQAFELGFNMAPVAGSILGYKHTTEARAKISAAGKGKVKTAEHIAKLSAARSKPIILTAPDGTETEWPSAKEAARAFGLDKGHLSKVLLGKYKHHRGFTARLVSASDLLELKP